MHSLIVSDCVHTSLYTITSTQAQISNMRNKKNNTGLGLKVTEVK